MRRQHACALLIATVLPLAACSATDGQSAGVANPPASSSATGDEYVAQVTAAFRDAYAASGGRGEGDPADWTAFVRVVEDLDPPAGREMDHEQMVAGFDAYLDALQDLKDTCAEHPGPGGPCFTAASAAGEQWESALERAYEIPGLSWDTMLG